MTIKETRDAKKRRCDLYRVAAARGFPEATVQTYAAVNETLEQDGAFVEMIVWIPRDSIACANEKAPVDWFCTRDKGHEGPCAAVEISSMPEISEEIANRVDE